MNRDEYAWHREQRDKHHKRIMEDDAKREQREIPKPEFWQLEPMD